MTLSGCVTLGETHRANLPDAPADLRTTVPQPEIKAGEDAVTAIAKSRLATKTANTKIKRWDNFYSTVKKQYGKQGLSTKPKKKGFRK